MTTNTYLYTPPLNKEQIVKRLYDAQQITFEEMCTLMQWNQPVYVPPYIPDTPQWVTSGTGYPIQVTYADNAKATS